MLQAMLTQDALEKPTNLNLYPKKRELERTIEATEKELAKKQKEVAGMQQMVDTYKNNPKFGNSKHFQVGKLARVPPMEIPLIE